MTIYIGEPKNSNDPTGGGTTVKFSPNNGGKSSINFEVI